MEKNDFENYKSELIDSDEDDLDHLNLDIQQELVEAGQRYIKMWKVKKIIHKKEKEAKRSRVAEILDEIDELTGGISNDALENNMRWMDVDHFDEVDQFDDDQIREKVQQELEADKVREDKEQEKLADQKDELYQELSDRERA
jgi:glycosidase